MKTDPLTRARSENKKLRAQLKTVTTQRDAALAVTETDNTFYVGGMSQMYRDRFDYDRQKVFAETLRAWRVNSLARRIVRIITSFVVGKGILLASEHKATDKFLQAWRSDPLNKINNRTLRRWMDELTRSGNMFFLFTVNPVDGMTYLRAVPADMIKEIQTAENDVEQELYYIPVDLEQAPYEAYKPDQEQESFMVHYAVNRPVGVSWGEPDLAPLLPWLGRYSSWLEDRVRLNRFRSVFMYIVLGKYKDGAAKEARQRQLNANPPTPGSILVTDESEQWGTLSANLDSFDASVDGIALKKHIAAGIGMPPHYFAEPESSTRTTAEAAGTPTFRNLEDIQDDFTEMLAELAQIAVSIRKRFDKRVDPGAEIKATAPDITERDNAQLAMAVNRIYPAVSELYDRELIDENELLRLVYRMAAESYEAKEGLKGRRRPLKPAAPEAPAPIPEPADVEEVPA